jgi:hypothetical protein
MTASESPSFVFRNTSFTMRARFTPDSACSTLTRMRDSLRLVRFSAGVRALPGAFFFRLVGLPYRRLVPLEGRIFI